MSTETRTNQGGSVVSFLVVGAILALVVLGTIYTVQNRNSDPQPSPSPSVSQSGTPQAPQESTPANPTATPTPTPTSTPRSSAQPSNPPASTDNLPATGPADDLVMLSLPIALLVGSAVAYARSRQDASHRLNR